MTLRLVTTPLTARLEWPEARGGGLSPDLMPAVLTAAGTDQARAKLADPNALVVTTGQQPGLFTGPLYTIHKALSAAALARLLEERWDRPVVPLFWIAGDDHDFAEANHASWLRADGTLYTRILRQRPPDADLTPLAREPLGPEVIPALEALAADLPPAEFRDETTAWLARHYRPEMTVAGAYGAALAELLAPLGILCFDSTHPAVKRASARHLMKALGLAQDLDRDLARQAEALMSAGRDPGVIVGDGATLVLLEAAQGRDRLVVDGTELVTRRSGERFSLAELQTLAAESPERFSPNVLLRPVMESALLPTVAYVAGPGELRYLPLAEPVYQRLRVGRQLPVPRWSGLLVESRVDRALAKFGLSLDDLRGPAGALMTRVMHDQLPNEVLTALAELRRALDEAYGVIERVGVDIDPTLERPLRGYRNHALSGARDAEKKLVQHLKRRRETELSQLARAQAAIHPAGKPQERVLTLAPFLARHGQGLLADITAAAEGWYRAVLEGAPATR